MSFLYPLLVTVGLPLVVVPLIIHLLNLRRQKPISWAAMMFLRESQRRNRTSIFFRQLLLLLMRMVAIAVLVLMLGGLMLQDSWARFFGSHATHHVVLIDDSFSMSDQAEEQDALESAKQVVRRIFSQASQQAGKQWVTLLTFSEAAGLTAGAEPQLYHQPVGELLQKKIESTLAALAVTQDDMGPAEALRGAARLPQTAGEKTQVLHVVSDLRARHFQPGDELRDLLVDLNELYEHLHLVQCVRRPRPNLAVTSLAAESGLRAAGVESWMVVSVVNYGKQTARDVAVRLVQDGSALPTLILPEIPPGEEVERRFRTQFAGVGTHQLEAALEADAVTVDNQRFFACELRAAVPILIIDGSLDGQDSFYLTKAIAPGGTVQTGWQPRVEPPAFLRDVASLDPFAAICLLDVDRLSPAAEEKIQDYVRAGGGLVIFLGENVDRKYYNQKLYREGNGFFPVPLKLPTQLLDDHTDGLPDVSVADHRLFRALAGERNSFLPLVMINYYYAVTPEWDAQVDPQTTLLAKTREGAPLVVEKRYGNGVVVAYLTKLSPADTALGAWSNWSLNPVFPVLANELMGYLTATKVSEPDCEVGHPIELSVDESRYATTMRFRLPTPPNHGGRPSQEILVEGKVVDEKITARLDDVAVSGLYQVELTSVDGKQEMRSIAVNVPRLEGDLEILDRAEIQRQLAPARFEFHYADQLRVEEHKTAGFAMSSALLAVLIVCLLCEQLLAYLASYHPATTKVRGL